MDIPNPTLKSNNFEKISHQRVTVIEELLAIGTALSSSRNLKELLKLILSKSREITCSDAGSVYLIDKSGKTSKLVFKVAQNDSLTNIALNEIALPLTRQSLAGYVALTGESLNIKNAYNLSSSLPYQLNRSFDENCNYRTCSVLVLPMQTQKGEIIGVLQLINRKSYLDKGIKITSENELAFTQPYSQWEERIVRSLASQAAISIERNMLQENIENLFEGFVRASVQAIEARDPITSGHSERVADLTVRLAEEVNSFHTSFLSVTYFNQRQIREIRYAALLHDFGKIGVPEAILTKRQKLHPGNLELIRQRFSLVQRTLEMECAQQKFRYLVEHPSHHHREKEPSCPHCQKLAELEEKLREAIEQLQEYRQLVEDLNEPLAFITENFLESAVKIKQKLAKLSQYTYYDVDGQNKPLITTSEIEQLMLPKGNLTPYERLAIESHVSQSYEFLKQIPWTKNLENVPTIASGHHEKIDGSGYPLGLKGKQIPIQSQIMAIADIYDALTAADRPYKRSLEPELALKILREEAENNKLNPELVKLFEQRQVYQVLGHKLE